MNAKIASSTIALFVVLGLTTGCATETTEPTPPAEEPTSPAAEPESTPPAAVETTPAPVDAGPASEYIVQGGDNLWNIAGSPDIYGNPYQWPLIYKTNSDKIRDADLIYPGQVFQINRNASTAEVNAAVQHARTRGAWSLGVVEQSDKAYLAE